MSPGHRDHLQHPRRPDRRRDLRYPAPGRRLRAGHRRLHLHHDRDRNFGSGTDETSVTRTAQGSVNVVNEASDPLGAGWSVGGLQQLSQLATDGPVLITAGQQGTEAFEPAYTEDRSTSRTWRWRPPRRPPRSWPTTARAISRRPSSAYRHRRRHRRGRFQQRRRARPGRRQLIDPGDRAQQRLGRLHRRQQLHHSLRLRGQGGRRRQLHRPRQRRRSTSPCCWPRPAPTPTAVAVYTGTGDGTSPRR